MLELQSIETSEGIFEKWIIDIDKDEDGIPFESPSDLDFYELSDKKLIRAMFPITKETTPRFVEIIEGSCTVSKRENFDVADKEIIFDEGKEVGYLIFNAYVQQCKNILFHRKIEWIYVRYVY